jgi:hypothetical protein
MCCGLMAESWLVVLICYIQISIIPSLVKVDRAQYLSAVLILGRKIVLHHQVERLNTDSSDEQI